MSISDDASEEKLDATSLQADWQPYLDEDDYYEVFPTDPVFEKRVNKQVRKYEQYVLCII